MNLKPKQIIRKTLSIITLMAMLATGIMPAHARLLFSEDRLDAAYTNDSDKILEVNNASGLEFESTVAADIIFDLQSTGDFMVQDAGTPFATFDDGGDVALVNDLTVDTDTLVVDSTNDRVGIGTASPDNTLHVDGGVLIDNDVSASDNFRIRNKSYNGEFVGVDWAGNYPYFHIVSGNDQNNNALRLGNGAIDFWKQGSEASIRQKFNEPIVFYTNYYDERMRITGDGNVGIGTNSPNSILHIEQNHDAVSDVTMINSNSGVNAMTRMRFENDISGGGVGIVSSNSFMTNYANRMLLIAEDDSAGILLEAQDSAGNIVFYTGGGVTERVKIDSSGNVGIGTASPGTLLHVDSNAANTTAITTLENTAGDIQVFRSDATPESAITGSIGDIAVDGTNGAMYIKNTGNGTNAGWLQLSANGSDLQNFDEVFAKSVSDGDTVLNITNGNTFEIQNDSTSDFTVDLQNTGDLVIQDAGTPFATFTDGGAFQLDNLRLDGNAISATSGNINLQPDNDTDDYIYLDTTSDTSNIYWSGTGVVTNDPGLRVNTTTQEMEYRDEDEAGWTTFDSLAAGTDDLDSVYDNDADKQMDVDNASGVTFDLTTTGDFVIEDNSTAFATFDDSGDVIFANDLTVDTDVLVVDSTNNRVGMGLASPSATLHVAESIMTGNDMVYFHNPTGGGGGTVLHVETQSGNVDEAVLIENDGTGAGLLIDNNSGSSTALNIDSEGTSAHAFQLTHRGDGTNTTGAAIDITAESGSGGMYIYRNQDGTVTDDSLLELIENNATADVDVMVIDNDGTGNAFSIDQQGNVGTDYTQNGALFVNGSAPGIGLNIFSKRDAATANAPLVRFTEDQTSDQDVQYILNKGTGNALSIIQRGDVGNNPGADGALYINGDAPGLALSVYSRRDAAMANAPLVQFTENNTSDQNVLHVQNNGTGNGIYLDQNGDNDALSISNDGNMVGIRIDQNGNGGAMEIDNSGTGTGLFISTSSSATAAYFRRNTATANSLFNLRDSNNASTGNTLNIDNAGTGYSILVDSGDVVFDENLVVGGSTSRTETLDNAGFTLGGDDLFVAGMAGVEGNVYTDGSFIAGASLELSDSGIKDTNGNINLQPDNDTDDYIYFDTTSNEEYIYFEDASLAYANDPGFRLNSTSGELEYRDENESSWTNFDSLAGGAGLWEDGTNGVYEDDEGVIVGIDQAETLSNTGFTLTTGDLFVQDELGVEGNVYTDGSFIAGASLTLGDTGITDSNSDMNFTSTTDGFNFTLGGGAGDDFIVDTNTFVVESDNNRVGIGTSSPNSILHIEQNHDAVSDVTMINSNSGVNAMTRMRFENDISGGGVGIVSSNSFMTNYANRMLLIAEEDSAGLLLNAQDSAGDIIFCTGGIGNERVKIDSSGNVGIGTMSPSAPFHVAKNTSIGNDMVYLHNPFGGGGGTALHVETQGGNVDEAVLIENDGTGAGLLIDNNASNSTALNIDSEGTSAHAFQLTHRGDGANTTGAAIDITAENGAGGMYIYRNQAGTVTDDSLLELFEDNATSDVPVMVIDNDGTGNSLSIFPSGNVGTSSSTDGALYINGDAPGTALNVYSRRNAAIANMPLVTFTEDNTSDQNVVHISNSGTGNSFRVDDSNGDTSPFVIDDSGNVGIGIASPSKSLEVYNGDAQIIRDDGSDVLLILNGDSNGVAWTIGNDDSATADFIISNASDLSDPIFFIGGSGGSYNERVGIRTTTPEASLDVGGMIALNGIAVANESGNIISFGDVDGGGTSEVEIVNDTGARIELDGVSGNIEILPDNDSDDYVYFDTTGNSTSLNWEGVLAYTNDPGVRINAINGELEYRDENESGWTSFDALGGAVGLWEDGTNGVYEDDEAVIAGSDAAFTYVSGSAAGDLKVDDDFEAGDDGFFGSDLVVGATTSATETLANTNFTLGGDDLFVAGTAGIKGNVYTDGEFIVGATLTINDDSITQTTGSAININLGGTAGDDFNIDSNTLVVESDNNRVGIGTNAPSEQLHVTDNIYTEDNLYVGSTSETIDNVAFVMDGDDTFVADSLGVEGAIYTDDTQTKYLWLDIAGCIRTSASLGSVNSGTSPVIRFDGTDNSRARWSFPVPDDWVSGTDITAEIFWSPANTTVGNVYFTFNYNAFADGETISGTNSLNSTEAAPGTALQLDRFTFTLANANLAADDMVNIRLNRLPGNVADTYAEDVNIHMIRINYTGKKLQ